MNDLAIMPVKPGRPTPQDLVSQPERFQPSAADVARGLLDPISPATAEILKPVKLQANDRLFVDLDDDGRNFIVQAYATVPGLGGKPQFVQASFPARFSWLQNVPERKDLKNNRWWLGGTDVSALIMNASWSSDRIDFVSPEARDLYVFLLARFMKQTVGAQQRALFKVRNQMPLLPDDWTDRADSPLAKYQVVGCLGCLDLDFNLFMQQGTGKTPTMLRAICLEAERFYRHESVAAKKAGRKRQLYRVFVACPKNVRYNWANEVGVFASCSGKVVVLRGGQLDRLKQIHEAISSDDDSRFAIVVGSYEAVDKSWAIVSNIKWHRIVCDEAHALKNPYSKRHKRFLQFRDCGELRSCLTGTPVTNHILDLFATLEFLGHGLSGFTTWKAFKKFHANCKVEGEGNAKREVITGYANVPFLQERLMRLSYIVSKEEALPNLPKKLRNVITVEMSKQQRQWYKALATQIALELEEGAIDGKRVTVQNVLTKLLRLAQVTSGFVKTDNAVDLDGAVLLPGMVQFINDAAIPKLEALVELVKSTDADEKVIVWACFLPDIYQIKARLEAEGIPCGVYVGATSDDDRIKLEREFNCTHAREMKVFIGNAAAGGTGLNLRGYDPRTVAPADNRRIRKLIGRAKAMTRGDNAMVVHGTDLKVLEATAKEAIKPHTVRLLADQDRRFKGLGPYQPNDPRAKLVEGGLAPDHGCNCTHVVYYSQNWSMVARNQSEDRAHRRGTRKPVTYTDIIVPRTIDEEIRQRVTAKTVNAMTIQDVRAVMNRLVQLSDELAEDENGDDDSSSDEE